MATNPLAMTNNGIPPGYSYDANGDLVYTGGQSLMQTNGSPLDPYFQMPKTPTYNPVFNQQTESLAPDVQNQLAGINLNPLNMSVQNFSDLANRAGPSAWATAAGQQQNALAENQLEQGGAESNAATRGAIDTLGSTGGITSGARERAAEGGAKNMMNMSQNVGRQNTLNQLQIGVNDQQNKMQEMGMLPGMESQALQPQFQKENLWQNARTGDIQNQIKASQDANQFNQNAYNQQMQAWGANQQANATMNSGKK